jgi:hypothetical protein
MHMIILFGGEEGASAALSFVLAFVFERSTKIIRIFWSPCWRILAGNFWF